MQEQSRGDLKRQVADRILSLHRPDETDSEFARRLGLSPQVINHYRTGRQGAALESVVQVVRATGVNMHWLVTGEAGPERLSAPPSIRGYELEELRVFLVNALRIVDASALKDGKGY